MHRQFIRYGIDITKEPMLVYPSLHYQNGGIEINKRCETSIPGLYVAGEASGGVHGRNRLMGNSVLDYNVFGRRAGKYAAEYAKGAEQARFEDPSRREYERLCSFFRDEGIAPKVIMDRIATLMSEYVGVARRETDLKKALSELESLRAYDLPKMRAPNGQCFNLGWIEAIQVPCMLDVAQMIIMSALHRTESRGAHFREDFPETKSEWLKHTRVIKKSGQMEMGTTPVIITKLDPEGRI